MSKAKYWAIAIALYLPMATVLAENAPEVPSTIQSLLTTGDTLLAFKSASPLGNNITGAVIIVRHESQDGQHDNPCELVVLNKVADKFAVSASNKKIIDCQYNESTKHALPLALNNKLTVEPDKITYFNELSRGGATYTISWSRDKLAWHLQHIEASSVENDQNGVTVYKSSLEYPATLPWMALTDFEPRLLREFIVKNRKVVE